jgi:hypothetical protein
VATRPAALLRITAELLDRVSRLTRYIEAVGPGESGEHLDLIASIKSPLEQLELTLADTLAATLSRGTVGTDEVNVLHGNLARLSRYFTTIHSLCAYLPSQPINPETVAVLEATFGEIYGQQNPSILPVTVFNALEFDWLKLVEEELPDLREIVPNLSSKKPVLQLAASDRDSPSAWPVLAHEMGHALDNEKSISRNVANDFVKDKTSGAYEFVSNWAAELCADLIAAEALGPASILALVGYEYCVAPQVPIHLASHSHPTTLWRLQVVGAHLQDKYDVDHLRRETALYRIAWRYSVQRAGASLPSQDTHDKIIFNSIVRPLAKALSARVKTLGIPNHSLDRDRLDRCLKRLRRGLPISAQGATRDTLRKDVVRYRALEHPKRTEHLDAFHALVERFREAPVAVQTILLSCQMRRLEIVDQFARTSASKPQLAMKELQRALSDLDRLVLNSIRVSSVHRSHVRQEAANAR